MKKAVILGAILLAAWFLLKPKSPLVVNYEAQRVNPVAVPVSSRGEGVNGIAPTYRGIWGTHTPEQIHEGLDRVAELPLEFVHIGFDWGAMLQEDGSVDWALADLKIGRIKEMNRRASLIVTAIEDWPETMNTQPLGKEFTLAYITHARAVMDRYGETLGYFWVDNEVNLQIHEKGLDAEAYSDFFNTVSAALRESHPDIPVGVIITFPYESTEEVVNEEEAPLFPLLRHVKEGTLIGVTYYPEFLGLSTEEGAGSFDRVDQFFEKYDVRYGITETGWSTKGYGASTEAQSDFYRRVASEPLRSAKREFLFTWGIYDPELSPFHKAVFLFSPGVTPWLESLGLLNKDGTAKPSWETFKSEMTHHRMDGIKTAE